MLVHMWVHMCVYVCECVYVWGWVGGCENVYVHVYAYSIEHFVSCDDHMTMICYIWSPAPVM